MEFRPRNYTVEEESRSLDRVSVDTHPLSPPSPSHLQVDVVDHGKSDFYDPLRGSDANVMISLDNLREEDNNSAVNEADAELPTKEWTSFKKFLMQRFSGSKMVSISPMSDVIMKSGQVREKASTTMHLEELDDPQKFAEDGIKAISQQVYVSRLHELKDEINRSWQANDRVTSLMLAIKVARLLMDTSVLQFYPTLFVLATDVMDMVGEMVWQRIKQKAEFSEDGNVICSLPENFVAKDICVDAKETCSNWFFKIGSIRELLPRIYLELAILPCWRFLVDRPVDVIQRLVMMTRGIADPLASAYCRLYIAHCVQKLPQQDTGYLIICINDIKILLTRFLSAVESPDGKFSERSKSLISLMEPTIEYIVKCIVKDSYETRAANILVELGIGMKQTEFVGKLPCISIILHHFLKELPSELVSSNAVEIFQLIESSKDYSFDQCLNYRLLGFRISESRSQLDIVNAVVDKVIKVASEYNSLDEFLKVVDAYVDIILQNQMDNKLNIILDGIVKRACNEGIAEIELINLQSIFLKLLAHLKNLEDIFSLSHFIEILDMMHGSARSMVNMHILNMATRKGRIHDPTIVQFLFEVSQSLHDGMDHSNMKYDDSQQPARLISRFVTMIDALRLTMGRSWNAIWHSYLNVVGLLVASMTLRSSEGLQNNLLSSLCSNFLFYLQETLVHSSNRLAVKAMKDGENHTSYVKSCIAFSEVTIPSVPSCVKQLNLYLETAEVALLSGLVSHSDGLLDSAIFCLRTMDQMDDLRLPSDVDWILSFMRKLCSLLVLVPVLLWMLKACIALYFRTSFVILFSDFGCCWICCVEGNPQQGVTYILRSMLALINSQSWVSSRARTRVLCAVLSLAATLSQFDLPYHANHELVLGNDRLFYGDPIYSQELLSLSASVLQNLVDNIIQEPSRVARGSMALEACNCIASSFNLAQEVLPFVSKLMETAKSCLSSNDKYLQSTIKFVDKFSGT
ncbi:hypothetical protein RHMOL_Rhmol04G0020200 [Rhododendron molle]|uniref:Uncharacterized protein n=1 Tax=Rhododendron molle TaxID=49168 RepID=A0ACC0NWD1_RHOML|nr:hypothetical protein RHMOL_Rhmol04G0020200 [Rhododendron molle]